MKSIAGALLLAAALVPMGCGAAEHSPTTIVAAPLEHADSPVAAETSATTEVPVAVEPLTRETVDHTDPASVVEAVFAAARSEDYATLGGLCDPEGRGDGDTKRLCALAQDSRKRADFVVVFEDGRITGDARIQGERASVPIVFGPGGTKRETFKLIQREGAWYLLSY